MIIFSAAIAMNVEGGIRSVEIGSLMFGKYDVGGRLMPANMELVRLAIPRRVYTQNHIDYVAEVVIAVFKERKKIRGLQIVEESPVLRHFTVKMDLLEMPKGNKQRIRQEVKLQ